jgi:hypothetical protein
MKRKFKTVMVNNFTNISKKNNHISDMKLRYVHVLQSSMTGAISGAGTATPSRAHEFTPGF